jgi:hypothetical protein
VDSTLEPVAEQEVGLVARIRQQANPDDSIPDGSMYVILDCNVPLLGHEPRRLSSLGQNRA